MKSKLNKIAIRVHNPTEKIAAIYWMCDLYSLPNSFEPDQMVPENVDMDWNYITVVDEEIDAVDGDFDFSGVRTFLFAELSEAKKYALGIDSKKQEELERLRNEYIFNDSMLQEANMKYADLMVKWSQAEIALVNAHTTLNEIQDKERELKDKVWAVVDQIKDFETRRANASKQLLVLQNE